MLLNKALITNGLKELNNSYRFHLFQSIDSTNRFLKDLPLSAEIEVCCAEEQTSGKGRLNKSWHSPFGENIYCSSRWSFCHSLNKLSGLSLIIGLAVIACLKEFYVDDIKIKWPNDLFWHDKKLCGILVESMTIAGATQVIIGVGINVNTDTEKKILPDKPWCSLYEIKKQCFDRNTLIIKLVQYIERYLFQFNQYNLPFFMEEWQQHDYLKNKNIEVIQFTRRLFGKVLGINAQGQLQLIDETGTIHSLSSGDTTVRI